MKIRNLIIVSIVLLMFFSSAEAQKKDYLTNFPNGKSPVEIGTMVTENLLSRPFRLTTFLNNKGKGSIHYAEIVTAYGAIKFSDITNDRKLLLRLTMYNDIMSHYKKLMAGLLPLMAESGLWHQLLDYPDSYEETSCTGMFTYSYIVGIKNGWLDADTYGPAARKGWLALVEKINENGEVSDVCVGTNEMHGADAYLQRERITGDFHGQAPVLWCANALMR